jgi:hypothetical protein
MIDGTRSSRMRGRAVALVAATALLPLGALAAQVNVSDTVSGDVPQHFGAFGGEKVACGSNCEYAVVSSSRLVGSASPSAGAVTATSWPPTWGSAAVLPPPVETVIEAPQDFVDEDGQKHVFEGGSIGVARRAAVDFSSSLLAQAGSRRVSSQTYARGSGSAVLSYSVKLTTGPGSAHWFVEFTPPTLSRAVQTAFFIGGPSGEQPIHSRPDSSAARSAVDVYIDGLPIWSSESSHHVPETFDEDFATDFLRLGWDKPLGGGRTTLWLGLLPPDRTYVITLLVRVDERVDAESDALDCPTDTEFFNVLVHRCHSQREALSLPVRFFVGDDRIQIPIVRFDFSVYRR